MRRRKPTVPDAAARGRRVAIAERAKECLCPCEACHANMEDVRCHQPDPEYEIRLTPEQARKHGVFTVPMCLKCAMQC